MPLAIIPAILIIAANFLLVWLLFHRRGLLGAFSLFSNHRLSRWEVALTWVGSLPGQPGVSHRPVRHAASERLVCPTAEPDQAKVAGPGTRSNTGASGSGCCPVQSPPAGGARTGSVADLREPGGCHRQDGPTPPHTVGQTPTVGRSPAPRDVPTKIRFGHPTVVAAEGDGAHA